MTLVTFLLPVYNGEKYLEEALKSLEAQTYKDFEVLIINDGSTDRTQEIINDFNSRDSRFKYISRENRGLIETLNEGLETIQTKYIARMDADDICHEKRLELQIQYMEENPHIGISGTNLRFFGDDEFDYCYSTDDQELKAGILLRPPFGHPSVIMRKELVEKHKLRYDFNFKDCEDYKLWLDMADVTTFGNVPQTLFYYRKHGESVSDRSKIQHQKSQLVRQIALSKLNVSQNTIRFHLDLCARRYNTIQLEYWPIYLGEFKQLGHSYLKIGFGQLKSFCQLYLPRDHAEQFYNCVKDSVFAMDNELVAQN